MLKRPIILILLLFAFTSLYAQEKNKAAKNVYEHYLDFNLARFQGDTHTALDMGRALIDSADLLPEKSRISFYNSLAKLYEDNHQPERAAPYYEKVTAATPNYYVAHRALGYIYLEAANDLFAKLTTTKKTDPTYNTALSIYKTAATQVIKHLEIAQACDPSDDTLVIIKTLYKNMGDTTGLASLDERLKTISKDCLDILSDN